MLNSVLGAVLPMSHRVDSENQVLSYKFTIKWERLKYSMLGSLKRTP